MKKRGYCILGSLLLSACVKPAQIPKVAGAQWHLELNAVSASVVHAKLTQIGEEPCGGLQAIEVQDNAKQKIKLMLVSALDVRDCHRVSAQMHTELLIAKNSGTWIIEIAQLGRPNADEFEFDSRTSESTSVKASFIQLK